MNELLSKYSGPIERVGFILKSGEVIEVDNVSSDPTQGFDVSADDILKHLDAVATWHTHPDASSNLSVDDYMAFRNFPSMQHYVVGNDGVRCYVVKDGVVHHAP